MAALVTNNATSTLAAGITSAATSVTLTTGQGALFPNPTAPNFFFATLVNASNAIEVVKCTARSGDSLTLVRAQDGTAALPWNAGDRCELRPTAGLFNNKFDLDSGGVIGSNTLAGTLTVNGPVSTPRALTLETAGVASWVVEANTDALGSPGSNLGANLAIGRCADTTGTVIDFPLKVARSTGAVTLADALQVNGLTTLSGGATITGSLTVTTLTSAGPLTVAVASTFQNNLTVDGAAYFGGTTTFSAYVSSGTPIVQLATGVNLQYSSGNLQLINGSASAYLDASGAFHSTSLNTNTITLNTSMSGAVGAIPFGMLAPSPTINIKNVNGGVQLVGGLILQWGRYDSGSDTGWNGSEITVTFPQQFPNALVHCQATAWNSGFVSAAVGAVQFLGQPEVWNASFSGDAYQSGGAQPIRGFFWLAIGY